MVSKRELRGFKILKGEKTRGTSLKLFAVNGSKYMVMITRYFFGMPLKRKSYEFHNLKQAEFFYEKLAYTNLKYRHPLS